MLKQVVGVEPQGSEDTADIAKMKVVKVISQALGTCMKP
jgi:hypothetical protein